MEQPNNQYGNQHYDVGIVGYWYATNYGSVLTYYALSEAINKMGLSTVLIDRPEKERDPEGEEVFSRQFLKTHCAISESVKKTDLNSLSDLCDSFIIGSDQVWTRDAIRSLGYMFFLSFVADDKRKIAYAPSFGTAKFDVVPDAEEKTGYYLHRFDHISIREDSGKELLKNKFHIDAYQAMDPVFLLDESDYAKISEESDAPVDEKYLLAYILDPTDDKEQSLKMLADKHNLKVKIILDGRKGTFERNKAKFHIFDEEILRDVDAADWVRYFHHADYVFTDSHHGLAMAIIFHKNLVCYANHGRGYTRFTSLLTRVGLLDRMVQNSGDMPEQLQKGDIDYEQVKGKLEAGINDSLLWLKDALTLPRAEKSKEYYLLKYELNMLKRSVDKLNGSFDSLKSDILASAKNINTEIDKIYGKLNPPQK